MTPELDKRIAKTFRSFKCDTCDGYATYSQSPSNPSGYPCDECYQTGFLIDGSTLNDLENQLNKTIEEYIKEFSS